MNAPTRAHDLQITSATERVTSAGMPALSPARPSSVPPKTTISSSEREQFVAAKEPASTEAFGAQAIGAAFTAHQRRLQKLAAKILGCPSSAEDVVQDAYIKAIETSTAVEIRQPVSYLYQVVRNLAIDRYRRVLLESRYFTSEEEGMQVVELASEPETIVIDRQHLQMVVDALAELPKRTQCAFKLCSIAGYTQREVAKHLKVSPTLVNFMIRDALKHCRDATRCKL